MIEYGAVPNPNLLAHILCGRRSFGITALQQRKTDCRSRYKSHSTFRPYLREHCVQIQSKKKTKARVFIIITGTVFRCSCIALMQDPVKWFLLTFMAFPLHRSSWVHNLNQSFALFGIAFATGMKEKKQEKRQNVCLVLHQYQKRSREKALYFEIDSKF